MTISGDVPGAPVSPQRSWFGHPPGLMVLFLTEMWERFSFYGMRALLQLFLTAPVAVGGFAMGTADAISIVAVYNAMVYFLALPGGWVADRLLGTRRSVLYGGIIIALGHYCLAVPAKATFFLGLGLIVIGTGLLKPNISAMVGELYDKRPELAESRRDAGFTLFYMGINVGALIAPLITGFFQARDQYHVAFGIAAVGMTFAVIQYVAGSRRLEGVGLTAHKPIQHTELRRLGKIAGLVALGLAALLAADVLAGTFKMDHVLTTLAFAPLVVAVAYFAVIFRDRSLTQVERSRVTAYVFMFLGAVLFWMIYDQAANVITDFTEKRVNSEVFGFAIPIPAYQSINPALILILAPLFAWLWVKLGPRNPTTSKKFSYALMLIGASFLLMAGAAMHAAARGLISPWWIVGMYFVQTVGELVLSPVGLSVTTKLAPLRYASQIMGLWFLATACGNALNKWVAPLVTKLPEFLYYGTLGLMAVLFGVCFWFASRRLTTLMAGVH